MVKAGRDRLPPGQVETKQFPILDLGVRPSRDNYSRWSLEIFGKIKSPRTLSPAGLKALGGEGITADFHCVTRWSRYDLHWTGIHFPKMIELAKPNPNAVFAIFYSYDKYTTNVSLGELLKPNVIVVYELDAGEIPPEHGGPIRMIIPHLYGWKSAKFLTGIEFTENDKLGFWETRGYSNRARPWVEERYSDG
ncbi:MAG: hypothetical protein A3H71_02410 [Candidatus Sungbacteria bacterium RIFCSPLOWO2_02_FULL_48_13b]|uniref:Oxidoreductase molybdopterin-binding domain-containing protein n=1 Tax=Candidatus Sungbacteria bacterium RIFCSPLOWO2_02_FULL_48_13b TaxID=1802283 RepID=A0A1G2LL35_9BACT|nr:MAG: hypothetical protein A3H71_02410 [Candidatus Sungbacteria bacterium RIFCSPLOWO2_02_FULL_48_13b]